MEESDESGAEYRAHQQQAGMPDRAHDGTDRYGDHDDRKSRPQKMSDAGSRR